MVNPNYSITMSTDSPDGIPVTHVYAGDIILVRPAIGDEPDDSDRDYFHIAAEQIKAATMNARNGNISVLTLREDTEVQILRFPERGTDGPGQSTTYSTHDLRGEGR